MARNARTIHLGNALRKLLFVSLFFVSTSLGCFTPIGKIPDSDFVWEDRTIKVNYQEVYRRVLAGVRTCKPGIAEGNLYTDIKEGHIDVFLVDMFGGKHPGVLGIILVKEDHNGDTVVRVGVQTVYDDPLFAPPGRLRKKWLNFAEGDLSCD